MKDQQLPESIINALEKGSFTTLSDPLKKEVLQFMTAEEYDDYHYSISSFQSMDQLIDDNIAMKFREREAIPSAPSIALWKALSIGLLIAALSFALGRMSSPDPCSQNEESIIFAHQDTLGKSLAEDNYPKELVISF